MKRFVVQSLQACDLEGLIPDGSGTGYFDNGIVVAVIEWEDDMGFPRVNVWGHDREEVLSFVRENWGDDEATGGWFSDWVVANLVEEVV